MPRSQRPQETQPHSKCTDRKGFRQVKICLKIFIHSLPMNQAFTEQGSPGPWSCLERVPGGPVLLLGSSGSRRLAGNHPQRADRRRPETAYEWRSGNISVSHVGQCWVDNNNCQTVCTINGDAGLLLAQRPHLLPSAGSGYFSHTHTIHSTGVHAHVP